MNDRVQQTIFKRFVIYITFFISSGFFVLGSAANDSPVVVFDFVPKIEKLDPNDPVALRRHYDEVLLVTCLQGLVNRTEPQLFVRYNAVPDDFWFQKMTEEGGWLSGHPIVRAESVQELMIKFSKAWKGVIIWDERVPATMNVAATVAGVEDLLAVRYDTGRGSLYMDFTSGSLAVPFSRSLIKNSGAPLFTGTGVIPETTRPSTGSAKNDAYIWLLENYIKKGKTNPRMIGYYIDAFWLKCWNVHELQNHTVNNFDYLIAKRGVILDLNIWEDEATVDDPAQPLGTDLRTFREILAACVEGNQQKEMIAVFGMVHWIFKYSNVVTNGWDAGGKHHPVASEWKFIEIITTYNGYADADALGYGSFPNGSFYQNYELPDAIKQDAIPEREHLIKENILDGQGHLLPVNYYAHFQGDYDAASWVYSHFPTIMDDPARGTLPLTWAIAPSLAERFPFGMHYIRTHSAPGEVFVAGEAAGYLNPSLLQSPRPAPGLPDALDLWVAHNLKWYRQWDISVTGFNIDGNTPAMNDRGFAAYQKFSPGGMGMQRAPSAYGVKGNMPYLLMMPDLPGHKGGADMGETVNALENFFEPASQTPHFVLVRSILQSPSYYSEIQRRLQLPGHLPNMLVDMPTLLWLVREYESNPYYEKFSASFADKKSVRANPEATQGLRIRRVADGGGVVETVNRNQVWRVSGDGIRYLYFDVADAFVASMGDRRARVRVTFLDAVPVLFGMEYDSSDTSAPLSGTYKAIRPVATSKRGEFTTVEFELPDALFSGRLNGGSDFRLDGGKDPMRILSVEVEKVESECKGDE